jgi:hypothetical protein
VYAYIINHSCSISHVSQSKEYICLLLTKNGNTSSELLYHCGDCKVCVEIYTIFTGQESYLFSTKSFSMSVYVYV